MLDLYDTWSGLIPLLTGIFGLLVIWGHHTYF
jgi:hypothetical protein